MRKPIIETYQQGQHLSFPEARVVLAGGCFDILHYGHIQFLEKARDQGDYLIVALEPDVCILRKHRQPIHTQKERAESLAALRSVDHVLMLPHLNGYEDYLQLVRDVSPQILAVTDGDPHMENQQKQADTIGAQLVIVNQLIDHLSSTKIQQQGAN